MLVDSEELLKNNLFGFTLVEKESLFAVGMGFTWDWRVVCYNSNGAQILFWTNPRLLKQFQTIYSEKDYEKYLIFLSLKMCLEYRIVYIPN